MAIIQAARDLYFTHFTQYETHSPGADRPVSVAWWRLVGPDWLRPTKGGLTQESSSMARGMALG